MASTQVVDLTSDSSPTITKAQAPSKAQKNANKASAQQSKAPAKDTSKPTDPAKTDKPEAEPVKKEPEAEWSEPEFTDALTRLDELQEKINTLRNSIPHMIATFTAPHATPASTHASFSALANASSSELRSLRTAWQAEDTQRILSRAKDRGEKLGTASEELPLRTLDGWELISSPDEKNAAVSVRPIEEDWDIPDGDYGGEPDTSREGLARVIEEFRAQHPSMEVTVDEAAKTMSVVVPVPKRPLEFTIQQAEGKDGTQFSVSCKGSSRLCAAITRSLKVNPFKNDLAYILDLIASYADLQTAKCVVCHTLLNEFAMLPVVRKLKGVKDADTATGTPQKHWIALHDNCT